MQIVEMRSGSSGSLGSSFALVDLPFGTTRLRFLATILTTKSTAKTIHWFKLVRNSPFFDVKRACWISSRRRLRQPQVLSPLQTLYFGHIQYSWPFEQLIFAVQCLFP